MKKWAIRIVLGIVLLLVIAAGAVWLMLDSLVKKGIQHGGQYALGVPTDVEQASLGLFNGSLMLDKLTVSNPDGFSSPHLLKTGRFDVQVRPASLWSGGPVEVQRFELDGLDINIEQLAKGNNISVVLEHIKKLTGPADEGQPAKDQGEGRKLLVGRLVIKNVVAHVRLPLPAAGKSLTITLPAIELDDVTHDAPDGVTIGGLLMRILPAVLASVVKQGADILPADLAGVLNGDLAATAQAMGGQAAKLVQDVGGESAKLIQQNLDKAVEDAKKNLGGAIKDLLDRR